jgi:hypothetical protein
MEVVFPVLLALILGLAHFFGEEFDEYTNSYNFLFVSFSAGFTVAYFFSVLIPEVMSNLSLPVQNASILFGFSIFYVLEEVLYEKGGNLGNIKTDFKEAHTLFISLYHISIGMMFVFLVKESLQQLLLFFLPVFLHTLVNSLAIKEMHEEMLDNIFIKALSSLSALIGVFLGSFLFIPISALYIILGVLGGAFIYIVVHDALDPRRERPIGFILGVVIFLLLMIIVTTI